MAGHPPQICKTMAAREQPRRNERTDRGQPDDQAIKPRLLAHQRKPIALIAGPSSNLTLFALRRARQGRNTPRRKSTIGAQLKTQGQGALDIAVLHEVCCVVERSTALMGGGALWRSLQHCKT